MRRGYYCCADPTCHFETPFYEVIKRHVESARAQQLSQQLGLIEPFNITTENP
jgi:hypothetical protein